MGNINVKLKKVGNEYLNCWMLDKRMKEQSIGTMLKKYGGKK